MREDWQSGFVETNGIRLHYTRTGGDKPPLVLAHGVTDAGPAGRRWRRRWLRNTTPIMVDARGHGHSDAPERGYGPAEQAEDLAGVIAALGLQRPAVLGHSMGAATALVLAGTYPDLPGAILLEDPPAWWTGWTDYAGRTRAPRRDARAGDLTLKRKTREELIAGQRAEQPGWSDAELEPWADAKQRFSPNVLSVFDQDNAANVDWPAILGRITCPALLITADPERGAIVTEESAAALEALVPQLEIAHVPEAGHNIRRDQFARYMDVVRAFLSGPRVGERREWTETVACGAERSMGHEDGERRALRGNCSGISNRGTSAGIMASKQAHPPIRIVGCAPIRSPRTPPTSGPRPSAPQPMVLIAAIARPCNRSGVTAWRIVAALTS